MQSPRVYDYLDYRRFLDDWITWKSAQRPGYGMGVFAMNAGLSRSVLPNVLAGRRQPNDETLDGFARAMHLDAEERDYLGLLVELHRATDLDQHAALLRRVFGHPRYGAGQVVDVAQLDGLSRWYALVIHELATLPDFQPDPAWIAARLQPEVPLADIAHALQEMRDAGLLGDQEPVHRLHTPPQAAHLGAMRVHQSALDAAKQALVEVPRDARSFHLATLSVPASLVPGLYAELEAMLARVRELADSKHADAEVVVQVNLQAWVAVGGEDK